MQPLINSGATPDDAPGGADKINANFTELYAAIAAIVLEFGSPPAIGAVTPNTLAGTTITATTQFAGPGTGLTGTAAALSIGGSAASLSTSYGGTLLSAQITTALGFTPYNATNPSAYITTAAFASPPAIGSTTPAAGTFTSVTASSLTITEAVGGSALTLTGATQTVSTPVINASQTWNAGAVAFTGLKLNVTDTASAATSLLLDLQVGGVSKFNVGKNGMAAGQYVGGIWLGQYDTLAHAQAAAYAGLQVWATAGSVNALTGFAIGPSIASPDVFIGRAAAASLRLGNADAAVPVVQTLGVQCVVAGTTDSGGANFIIRGSAGTGTGAAGGILFKVAPASTTGSAQNAFVTRLTVDALGVVISAVTGADSLLVQSAAGRNALLVNQSGGGAALTVAAAGNVTIAAPTSGVALTVNPLFGSGGIAIGAGTGTGTNPTVFTASGSTDGSMNHSITNSGAGAVSVSMTAGTVQCMTYTGTAWSKTGTTSAHPFYLQAAGTVRLAIAAAGNITIAAPTSGSALLVNEAVGGSALTLTGATQTTNQPVISATQTWNGSGVTFTGFKLNVTDTLSAGVSNLIDLQIGGVSQFKVGKSGVVIIPASAYYSYTGRSGILSQADGDITFANSTQTSAVRFFVKANASLQLGAPDAAAPVAQTLGVQSVVAGTTDTAGAALTIQGSRGTGTGAGGSIIFQVAPAGLTGSTQNALATALSINSTSGATFTAATVTGAQSWGLAAYGNTDSYLNYSFKNNGTGNTQFFVQAGASSSYWQINGASGGVIFGAQANAALALVSNNLTRLTIGAAGNVAIAAPTSSTALGVAAAAGALAADFTAGPVKKYSTTVAGLIAAATAGAGAECYVTDSNATHTAGIGAVVAAGGANFVPVYSDGTAWRIG